MIFCSQVLVGTDTLRHVHLTGRLSRFPKSGNLRTSDRRVLRRSVPQLPSRKAAVALPQHELGRAQRQILARERRDRFRHERERKSRQPAAACQSAGQDGSEQRGTNLLHRFTRGG